MLPAGVPPGPARPPRCFGSASMLRSPPSSASACARARSQCAPAAHAASAGRLQVAEGAVRITDWCACTEPAGPAASPCTQTWAQQATARAVRTCICRWGAPGFDFGTAGSCSSTTAGNCTQPTLGRLGFTQSRGKVALAKRFQGAWMHQDGWHQQQQLSTASAWAAQVIQRRRC